MKTTLQALTDSWVAKSDDCKRRAEKIEKSDYSVSGKFKAMAAMGKANAYIACALQLQRHINARLKEEVSGD